MEKAKSEWSRGWTVIAAAMAGMAMSSVHAYSMGVMIGPIEAEFGWPRSQITLGMMISSLMSVALSPFFGMMIDRFGPRRIALLGVLFYCASLALLSTATASLVTWCLLWTVLATSILSVKPTLWVAAVTSLFRERRGMALALVLSATGISQAVTPAITYSLVEHFGWRMAYLALSGGSFLITYPLIILFFRSARDLGDAAPSWTTSSTPDQGPGLSVRDGLRSAAFLKLGIAALAMSLAGAVLTVNLVPVLTSAGFTTGQAAGVAAVSGGSAIVGRLGCGYLLDRYDARFVGGISVLLPIGTSLILLYLPGHLGAAILAALLGGLAAGAEMDAISYLSGRFFGLRNFGALFGSLAGILALGVGMGPSLANLIYDMSKSYAIVLWSIVPFSLLTSAMFLTLGSYPKFRHEHI
ncbi:MAG TPA: MFS transporter [Sphingobium sp.]|uniref:MFS transporter n=1 Tax=Sphingobium sp. TaxID=1912891 RepID=UPI002ED471F1